MSAALSDWEVAEHEDPPEPPGAAHAAMAELHNRSAQLAAEHATAAHKGAQEVAGSVEEKLRAAMDLIEELAASCHQASMEAHEASAKAMETEGRMQDMMDMQKQMVEAFQTIAQALGPKMAPADDEESEG